MFTETWTNEYSDLNVDNFTHFILNRTENKKSCKRNSGGIIIYIRNQYVSDDTLVFKSCDDIISAKLSGSLFSLTCDLFICLTYVLPDDSIGIGRHTFVGSRGSSVVDYVLASQNLFSNIDTFSISDPNILSDHCIVSFSLNFTKPEQIMPNNDNMFEKLKYKYVWDKHKGPSYIEELNSRNVLDKLNALNNNIDQCIEGTDIDVCIENFNDIVENVSAPYFKRNLKQETVTGKTDSPCFTDKKDNPWYDDDCHESKKHFLNMLNKYRAAKTDVNRINMVKARSAYKTIIRNCKKILTEKKHILLPMQNIKMPSYIGKC